MLYFLWIQLIMMTTIPHFHLSIALVEPAMSVSTQMELDFSKMGALAQTWSSHGGFDFDQASGKFELEWTGMGRPCQVQHVVTEPEMH